MSKLIIAKWDAEKHENLLANGLVRPNPNKPEFGSIMLVERGGVKLSGGFLNITNKVGFIPGRVKDLERLVNSLNLTDQDDFNAKTGENFKIVAIEKVESDMTEDDLGFRVKVNPATTDVMQLNGEDIYRKVVVVSADNPDVKEVLIKGDGSREATEEELEMQGVEVQAKKTTKVKGANVKIKA